MSQFEETQENHPYIYIYPSQESYAPEKALVHWLQTDAIDCIDGLASIMHDALSHIKSMIVRTLISEENKDKVILQDDSITLATIAQPIIQKYTVLIEITNLMYYYRQRWIKRKNLDTVNIIFDENEIKFLGSVYQDYAAMLPRWYRFDPEDFLAVMVPLIEPDLTSLGELIQALYDIPDIDAIQLFKYLDRPFTLRHASDAFSKNYKIVSEAFFLLKSHSDAHKK